MVPPLKSTLGLAAGVDSLQMDRKELLRKEYNRVIETRLPNIYSMMNKFNDPNL
jgi:hypothetical protein